MFDDVSKILHGEDKESLGKPTPVEDVPEELLVATGALLSALGQDYGITADSSPSRKAEFWDKARRVAARFQDMFQICESMPHQEYGEE